MNVLKNKIINDKYTEYIYTNFDIQNRDYTEFEIPKFTLPQDGFSIGLICGASGSGKSTLLKQIGEIQKADFDNTKALISNFDYLDEAQAGQLLSSVGLGSVPNWLKPYKVLSTGEKFRADMAFILGKSEGLILIDEFTSVVDRTVAQGISNSIQKYIRKNNKQVIFASCHYDIIEWLQPDWIYYTETQKFVKKKSNSDLLSNSKYGGENIVLGIYSKNIII